MLDLIEYTGDENGIVIFRCCGDGGRVEIPDRIGDIPVRELADHCFAGEPSVRLKDERRYYAEPDQAGIGWEKVREAPRGQVPQTVCTGLVEDVYLPEGLTRIGDYAFYGCRNLKTVHFPASLNSFGRGVFVAVGRIKELWFEIGDTKENSSNLLRVPACMRDVLGDINYGVQTVLACSGKVIGSLYFPGYYEESIENTPARIIEVKYRGTGYKYRQCFREGMLDLRQYDELLYETSNWEDEEGVARLCLDRLSWPLPPETKGQYESCLRENSRGALGIVFGEKRFDLLKLLCEIDFFTPDLLEIFTDQAAKMQDAQAVSLLIDYRKKKYPEKRRRYIL